MKPVPMSKLYCFLLLFLWNTAHASTLPATVVSALQQAHIPLQHVGIVVWDTSDPQPEISFNAVRAFNPASTMKLVTSYAALSLLGPAYTWPTEVSMDGSLQNGVLNGNLYLKGYGDPSLNMERFWVLVHQLRQRGLHQINGDLVIDQNYFQLDPPSNFDDQPRRAYNAQPAALMVNFNSTAVDIHIQDARIALTAEPLPPSTSVVNKLVLDSAPCGEWRDRIHTDWQVTPAQLIITGQYSLNCGDKSFAVTLGDASALVAGLFTTLWQNEGGKFNGAWRTGNVPSNAQPLMTYTSPPLAQAVYNLNKYSNNVMARTLFLGLSSAGGTCSTAKSTQVVIDWLKLQNLDFPELAMENGAGLSRVERIAPYSMARLLRSASQSPVFAELAAALPIVTVDGTMKKRGKDNQVAAHAHIKTGTLDGVKTMAGYVTTEAGHQVVVVFFINDTEAAAGSAAQDALLEWVYTQAYLSAVSLIPVK